MRVRYPFAGAFGALMLISAYVGLTPLELAAVNDKVLHFVDFFLLTLTGYWAVEAPRRLLLKVVLGGSLALAVGSELIQGLLPNGRDFDPIDIAANVLGSVIALALCSWYHRRMLERRRQRKLQGYGLVEGVPDEDVELGEGGASSQELGVTSTEHGTASHDHNDDDYDGEAWDDMDAVADDANGSGEVHSSKAANAADA